MAHFLWLAQCCFVIMLLVLLRMTAATDVYCKQQQKQRSGDAWKPMADATSIAANTTSALRLFIERFVGVSLTGYILFYILLLHSLHTVA